MEENNGIIVAQDEPAIVDLLSRDDFIKRLVEITENLAAKKKGICYAINGEWGVGKTFALNLYKEVIRKIESENGSASKYLIFEYNAWEYDYYSEPLIAIVAALLDLIEKKVNIVPTDNQLAQTVIAIAKEIGKGFVDNALSKLKDKSGLDFNKLKEIALNSSKEAQEKIAESHSYDPFFDFKDALTKLSETIASLAEDQTVVFIVDELDRCLPEYTIKVLERLHHLFENVPNVQVILSVDKRQLESTVSHIYGDCANIHRYLAKFIAFEMKLDFGTPSNLVKECYSEYYDCFSFEMTSEEEVLDYYVTLFEGIDMRRCKAIVEKSFLCHQLVYPNSNKSDAFVLCIELFLSLMKDFRINESKAKTHVNGQNLFTGASGMFSSLAYIPSGLLNLESQFKPQDGFSQYRRKEPIGGRVVIATHDIFGLILGCYRLILGIEDDVWINKYNNVIISDDLTFRNYVKKYWEILHAIN